MHIVFHNNNCLKLHRKSAIVLGTFDGIHLGHRKLLDTLSLIKKQRNLNSVIFTFMNHPLKHLAPNTAPKNITTLYERIELFSDYNADFLILNDFRDKFARLTPKQFIEKYFLSTLNVDTVIVGYNYRFGENASGDVNFLKEYCSKLNINVIIVPPVRVSDLTVSSTLIRDNIKNGQINMVSTYLGRPYSITGRVVKGYGIGRQMGFPTANIIFDKSILIPAKGVYSTSIIIGNRIYKGVTNIGTNPTFTRDDLTIETFILKFNGMLYGDTITILFLDKIRDEIKFNTEIELIDQIKNDIEKRKMM